MTRFRRRFPRRRMSSRYDMQEFNQCRHPIDATTSPDCDSPALEWTAICFPSTDTLSPATGEPAITKGLSFGGCRFRYAYHIVPSAQPTAFGEAVVRIWSGLVVAPCTALGFPLPLAAPGGQILGTVNGDIGQSIRILWRSLDFISVFGTTLAAGSFNQNFNGPIPLQHVKARAFLKEGMALYWVSEIVSGLTAGNGPIVDLDVSMSLALRSVVR